MKSKTKYIRVIFTLIFIPYFQMYGQENNFQELNELLIEGRYFESKRLYHEIHNNINPDTDLYYKFWMARFMNKDDSAVIYMEKMMDDYPWMFGDDTIDAYAMLFSIYAINLRNYKKSLYTYERMEQHLNENPYNLDEKEISLWRNGNITRADYLKQIINLPPIKIKRPNVNSSVELISNDRLLVEIKVNGIEQKIYFDTGCNFHYIMNRKEALRMGIKCNISEMNKGIINDTEILTKQIIIDSLEIGNITIYNVPTTIFEHDITAFHPDSMKNNKETLARMDSLYTNITRSVIGLPIMKLIGKILIDYEEQTVSFPIADYRQESIKEPNLYTHDFYLYARLKINEKDFVGTLDTGFDDYIKIDTLYYEKYKNNIPTTQALEGEPYHIMMVHKIWNNIPYKIAYNPIIKFNNNQMNPPAEDAVRIHSLSAIWHEKYFDGVIGYDFFKRIGKKVLLDLDNMRLEAIE